MKRTGIRLPIAALLLALIAVVVSAVGFASEDADDAVRQQKLVRKILINCEEDSAEDCEHGIRVEAIGKESHVVQVGDHHRVWVEGGPHGSHYAFRTSFAGNGGFLGVQLTDLTAELRSHFGVAEDEGVMVSKVVDDSAAFRAGLQVGDIITRFDGETVESAGDLTHAVRTHEEGDVVSLEIWRENRYESLSATIDKQADLGHLAHRIQIDCDETDENCGMHFMGKAHHAMALDCPDGERCEVKIDCDDGDCSCWLDGAEVDCEDLHSERHSGN